MRTLLLGFLLIPLATLSAAPQPPPEKELKALVLESLLTFNQSVQAKDFRPFHAYVSKLWQQQITPEKLKTVFKTFIDQGINVDGIARVDPVFDAPAAVDGDGLLVVQGHYPLAVGTVEFRLKYVYEKPAWKVFGIKVNVAPSGNDAGKVPSEKEAQALARESLLAFNRALQARDFTSFHQSIATPWREQTTPEKLQAIFQSFIDKEIDLSAIAKMTPVFQKPPGLLENGVLEMEGTFPTRPSAVHFSLAYLYEAPDWKLVKIKVNLEPEGENPDAAAEE